MAKLFFFFFCYFTFAEKMSRSWLLGALEEFRCRSTFTVMTSVNASTHVKKQARFHAYGHIQTQFLMAVQRWQCRVYLTTTIDYNAWNCVKLAWKQCKQH